jgi:hypothetical protein
MIVAIFLHLSRILHDNPVSSRICELIDDSEQGGDRKRPVPRFYAIDEEGRVIQIDHVRPSSVTGPYRRPLRAADTAAVAF